MPPKRPAPGPPSVAKRRRTAERDSDDGAGEQILHGPRVREIKVLDLPSGGSGPCPAVEIRQAGVKAYVCQDSRQCWLGQHWAEVMRVLPCALMGSSRAPWMQCYVRRPGNICVSVMLWRGGMLQGISGSESGRSVRYIEAVIDTLYDICRWMKLVEVQGERGEKRRPFSGAKLHGLSVMGMQARLDFDEYHGRPCRFNSKAVEKSLLKMAGQAHSNTGPGLDSCAKIRVALPATPGAGQLVGETSAGGGSGHVKIEIGPRGTVVFKFTPSGVTAREMLSVEKRKRAPGAAARPGRGTGSQKRAVLALVAWLRGYAEQLSRDRLFPAMSKLVSIAR
eukprot:TRINITY_DN14984_c0_g1_i1.p1 TRINITY_DN14984_c0_g1~~TRINITY_DN14984_c0_g1_i1.p1  ORF type:complete len:361 (+),score=83.98 TRINITY_DN14984_c0_g1_i1:78-1085(+)